MPRRGSFAVLIALLCANLASVAAVPSKAQFGKIKGTIVDVNDARIVSADVVIAGGGLSWRIRTNSEGEFEMSLPAGKYQFVVEANGFSRSRPSQLIIKSRKIQRVNVKMQVAPPTGLVPAGPNPQSD